MKIRTSNNLIDLISNTTKKVEKISTKPYMCHEIQIIDGAKRSGLLMSTTNGQLDNVIIVFAGKIKAVINNLTGELLFEKKPFFMSFENASKKTEEFLQKLNPAKMATPKTIDSHYRKTNDDHILIESLEEFSDKEKIIYIHKTEPDESFKNAINSYYTKKFNA